MLLITTTKPNNMRRPVLLLLFFVILISCGKNTEKGLPRIAIAGLGIESSTFSPALTHEEAFHPKIGDSIFTRYPFMEADSSLRQRAEWVPTLVGKSLPGGTVTREAYESLVGKTLTMLEQNMPYDGPRATLSKEYAKW